MTGPIASLAAVTLSAVALAAATGSAAAIAQPSPFCGKGGAADRAWVETRLIGRWEMVYHAGFARVRSPQSAVRRGR